MLEDCAETDPPQYPSFLSNLESSIVAVDRTKWMQEPKGSSSSNTPTELREQVEFVMESDPSTTRIAERSLRAAVMPFATVLDPAGALRTDG